jgi:hypothetical protein
MILGLELIRGERHPNGMILVGVDNTSAITAMHSIKLGPGHYLWDLFHRWLQMVSDRHQDMDLLIRWTPGHINIEGNKEANKEAKTAAKPRATLAVMENITTQQISSSAGIPCKTEASDDSARSSLHLQ